MISSSMMTLARFPSRPRAALTGIFVATIAWQVYVVFTAFRYAPRFRNLFDALGAELPLITRSLVATYRFWIAIPAIFTLLAIRAIRNHDTSATHVGVLAGLSAGTGFVLQAWLHEGYFAPMFDLIRQIG